MDDNETCSRSPEDWGKHWNISDAGYSGAMTALPKAACAISILKMEEVKEKFLHGKDMVQVQNFGGEESMKKQTVFLSVLFLTAMLCVVMFGLLRSPQNGLGKEPIATVLPGKEAGVLTEPVATSSWTTETIKIEATEPVHVHTYTGEVTKAPSCTESGVRTFRCTCGASYRENIVPLAHAYVVTAHNPTCTQRGNTTYVCKICGYQYQTLDADALGHHFEPWETEEAPSEHQTGLARRQCARCQKTETSVLPAWR